MLDPGQMGQRAELRGDRHVFAGFRNDRRLAGKRVAYQRQLVARAHEECKEAVEIRERVLQRGLQRLAPPEPPVNVAACALGVAIALEALAEFLELTANTPGIRKRAVVNETPVLASR